MKYMKEALYYLNSDYKIPLDILKFSIYEWINTEDEVFSNYFITVLLHGMKFKNYPIEYLLKLSEIIYEIDNFKFKDKKKLEIESKKLIVELSGSGKKGIKTINISTLSAIIASSLGIPIIKNISSSTSSLSGSLDFFKYFKINTNLKYNDIKKGLENVDFSFYNLEKSLVKFNKKYNKIFHTPHFFSTALSAIISPYKSDIILYGNAQNNMYEVNKFLGKYYKRYVIYNSTNDNVHYCDEITIYKNNIIFSGITDVSKEINDFIFKNFSNYFIEDYSNLNLVTNINKGIEILKYPKNNLDFILLCLNSAFILNVYSNNKVKFEKAYEEVEKVMLNYKAYTHFKNIIKFYGGILNE